MTKQELQKHIEDKNSSVLKRAIETEEIFLISSATNNSDKKENILLTKEEHLEYLEEEKLAGIYYNVQYAIKILLNSLYGCLGTKYCRYFDIDMAKSITLTGQTIIKGNGKYVHDYLTNDLYNEKSIKKIFKNIDEKYEIRRSPSIYNDTDSSVPSTMITINKETMTIENLYNKYEKEVSVDMSQHGHEILDVKNTDLHCLTFDSKNEKVKMGKVDKIIRHKVTKAKWVMKSKCGKEIIVTGDHSLMVIRDGKLIEIKPKDVDKNNDKIVVLKKKKT